MTNRPTPVTADALPPFSGDDPTCIKCGFTGADTEYVNQQGRGWIDYAYPAGPRVGREHLRRRCMRCGYGWPEAILAPTTERTTS